MEEGYLVSSERVTWSNKNGTFSIGDEKVRLPGSSFWLGSDIPAYRCGNCKLIIIKY